MCSSGMTSSATAAAFRLRGSRARRRTRAACAAASARCSSAASDAARERRSCPWTSQRRSRRTRARSRGANSDGDTSCPGNSGGIGQSSMSQTARSSSPSADVHVAVGADAGGAGIDEPRRAASAHAGPSCRSALSSRLQAACFAAAAAARGLRASVCAPASNADSIVVLAGAGQRREQHRALLAQPLQAVVDDRLAARTGSNCGRRWRSRTWCSVHSNRPSRWSAAPARSKHVHELLILRRAQRPQRRQRHVHQRQAGPHVELVDGLGADCSVSSNTSGSADCSSMRSWLRADVGIAIEQRGEISARAPYGSWAASTTAGGIAAISSCTYSR